MATPIPENQCRMTLAEAARATCGTLRGDGALEVVGVWTDSRTIKPGGLFVALRGSMHDGHAFLDQAASHGARAAIVQRGSVASIATIEVDDTLPALGNLARFHTSRLRADAAIPTIAIGGAVGKTTTRELTAAAVRALFGDILATPGNLNNLIGVPMVMLGLGPEHCAMVLECGTNTRGEIPQLAAMVEPDIAMVLNVDIEHSEGLGTLQDIADEEAALFQRARRAIVYGADEPLLIARLPAATGIAKRSFGWSDTADVRVMARRITSNGRSAIRLRLPAILLAANAAREFDIELGLIGRSAATNAAAAVAGAAALFGRPLESHHLDAIGTALAEVCPVEGRLALRRAAELTLIDDSYNANPRSVRDALAAVAEIAAGLNARLVVALGDMLELGPLTKPLHAEIVREVIAMRPAVFLAVGSEMSAAVAGLPASASGSTVDVAADSACAAALVRSLVRAGDVVLIKGSRGIQMERIVTELSSA